MNNNQNVPENVENTIHVADYKKYCVWDSQEGLNWIKSFIG